MKTFFLIYLLGAFSSSFALADTPSGTKVIAKMFAGDGITAITSTGSSLNVDVTGSTLPVNACQESGGHLSSIDAKLTSPLSVTGSVTASSPTNGLVGATAPVQASNIGGTDSTGKLQSLSVSAGGVLSVDASGHSVPVTGTFWQATQPVNGTVTANAGSGTFNVDASGHTVPVSGAFWQATQPVSAASLPLPSGAASAAKQPALGIAGTPSADVLTVQGAASMAPLLVDGSGSTQPVSGTFWQAVQPVSGSVTANVGSTGGLALDATIAGLQIAQGSTTAGELGQLSLGAVSTSAPSYTTAKSSPLSLTTAGALRVDGSSVTQPVSGTVGVSSLPALPTGGNTIGAVNVNGTVPVSGTFWQATQPVSGSVTANIGTTNGLALDSSVNGLLLGQNSTTSGQTGPLSQAAVSTAAPTYATGKTQPLSMTTSGALRVDNTGNTQPVSGTVTANAGTGTFTVDASGHTVPVSGTFWQATQPVSAASLPLPSGAATAAKQPALGTAGTPSADVLTIQGAASMTALKMDGSGVTQPVSGTFWQATQPVSLSSIPALVAGSAKIGQVAIDQTTPGTSNLVALAANQSVNFNQVAGNTVSTGNGTAGTGVQRVTVASDNSAIPTKAPVNPNGTLSARQTVTTTESTVAAPANAIAFYLVAESVNADNIRWGISNATTAILSSTLGMLTEPGRSWENVPMGTGIYLHLISTGGGTDYADVQWVLSQ